MSPEEGEHGHHSLCPCWAYCLQAYQQKQALTSHLPDPSATSLVGRFPDCTVPISQGYFLGPHLTLLSLMYGPILSGFSLHHMTALPVCAICKPSSEQPTRDLHPRIFSLQVHLFKFLRIPLNSVLHGSPALHLQSFSQIIASMFSLPSSRKAENFSDHLCITSS